MKLSIYYSLILISILLSSVSIVISVQGLFQDEIQLSFDWSTSDYFQGDRGNVTINLGSTCDNELEFYWIGIQFAWMSENQYYSIDLKNNPIRIPSESSITFDAISFIISPEASVGLSIFRVHISLSEHHFSGWESKSWISSRYQLIVYDAYEQIYQDMEFKVYSNLTMSQKEEYESAEAKAILAQAQNEYDFAISLATHHKWEDATNHLQAASNLVLSSNIKEAEYQTWKASEAIKSKQQRHQNRIILGIGLSFLGIVAAIIIIRMRRAQK
jgi:hypothetical protein